jgi:phosphoribosylaminoimidazole carboxylase PurE protein
MNDKPQVLVITGSPNDVQKLAGTREVLEELGIPFVFHVASAHRTPERAARLVEEAERAGVKVVIACAGMANHLAGAAAARTVLPVIGVPLGGGALGGLDALLSTVQMPPGIPVATVAVGGSYNAAVLAAQILATRDAPLRRKLQAMRRRMRKKVEDTEGKIAL